MVLSHGHRACPRKGEEKKGCGPFKKPVVHQWCIFPEFGQFMNLDKCCMAWNLLQFLPFVVGEEKDWEDNQRRAGQNSGWQTQGTPTTQMRTSRYQYCDFVGSKHSVQWQRCLLTKTGSR